MTATNGSKVTNGRVLILSEREYNDCEEEAKRKYGLSLQEFVQELFGNVTVLTYDRIGGSDV